MRVGVCVHTLGFACWNATSIIVRDIAQAESNRVNSEAITTRPPGTVWLGCWQVGERSEGR